MSRDTTKATDGSDVIKKNVPSDMRENAARAPALMWAGYPFCRGGKEELAR